jgi:putative endonuclease
MHFVYIIYSCVADRYYVGETSDYIQRIYWHNTGEFGGSATSLARDWKIKKLLHVDTCGNGKKVEAFIKSMKSRKFLIKLLTDQDFFIEFKRLVFIKFGIKIS